MFDLAQFLPVWCGPLKLFYNCFIHNQETWENAMEIIQVCRQLGEDNAYIVIQNDGKSLENFDNSLTKKNENPWVTSHLTESLKLLRKPMVHQTI